MHDAQIARQAAQRVAPASPAIGPPCCLAARACFGLLLLRGSHKAGNLVHVMRSSHGGQSRASETEAGAPTVSASCCTRRARPQSWPRSIAQHTAGLLVQPTSDCPEAGFAPSVARQKQSQPIAGATPYPYRNRQFIKGVVCFPATRHAAPADAVPAPTPSTSHPSRFPPPRARLPCAERLPRQSQCGGASTCCCSWCGSGSLSPRATCTRTKTSKGLRL